MAPVAAAVACVLCLSALAIVDAGPARAANTASELRVDPQDRLLATEADGIRPFAGNDRYETAALLADRYLFQRGGFFSNSTVILASGESLVDGLVATGLAGREQAPILLTPPNELSPIVADFIDDHAISTVVVVGGAGAVSDSVLTELAALDAKPAVRRVGGADRYATAAAAAAELDGHAEWCGLDGNAAVLVNGDEARLAEIVGIGPLAFAHELPILLTRADELPSATVEFLRQHRIDRLIILGGKTVVSDDLISPLLAEGVAEVTRFASTSRGISESAMAQLITVTCRHELQPSQNFVALVSRDSPIDAVAAAPVLRAGLDDSGPVPVVLAGDALPSATRSVLARTPREIDGLKHHLLVVAIGGLGAIDEATMNAAINAAASGRALTARISATAGSDTLRISFSESLNVDFPRFGSRIRDLLHVNDAFASILEQELVSSITSDPCGRFAGLNVKLHHELEAGDVIWLEDLESWHSSNDDRRQIRGATYTVPEPRPSFRRPSVEVIALPGQSKLWVSVTANEYRDPESGPDGGITINSGRVTVVAEDGSGVTVGAPESERLDRFLGTALFSFQLRSGGSDYTLANDDRVIFQNGLATNANDRQSAAGVKSAAEVTKRLGVTAVRVGPPNPSVDDSVRTTRPEEIATVSKRAQASLGDSLLIVGKWSGSAAGAAGNSWTIHSTRADTALATPTTPIDEDDPPDTQVWVDTTNQIISIRHINAPEGEMREQTYGALAEFLNSNRDFSRHFLAELDDPCEGAKEVVDLDEEGFVGSAEFSGGISSVSFLVTFNDYINEFVTDGTTVIGTGAGATGELVDDILDGLIPDYGQAVAGVPPDRIEVAAPTPGKELVFRFTTEDPEHTIGQMISIRNMRIDIREGIAQGYRADDDTTVDVDESVNSGRALFALSSRDSRLLSGLPR